MPSTSNPDRVFPLSGGSALRPALRPPRLSTLVTTTPGVVLGHRAFLRAWAARRAQSAAFAAARTNAGASPLSAIPEAGRLFHAAAASRRCPASEMRPTNAASPG